MKGTGVHRSPLLPDKEACLIHRTIRVDGKAYELDFRRSVMLPPDAPRLVIAGFQPNAGATALLALCIDSVRRFTNLPHELWVIDNASPPSNAEWLHAQSGINVVFNRTIPREPRTWTEWLSLKDKTPHAASYANGIALELVAALIDARTEVMVTLHQDTMACHPQWLPYLLGKLDGSCRASGVRLDTHRVTALHVLGMAFDFQLYRTLGLTFRHDLPRHDVGDGISIGITQAGYRLGACRNTHGDPTLSERLQDSRFKGMSVDRALDDEGNVIFMHLGRGTLKSQAATGSRAVEEWLAFGRRWIAAPADAASKGSGSL